jgi:hypothetical protein
LEEGDAKAFAETFRSKTPHHRFFGFFSCSGTVFKRIKSF